MLVRLALFFFTLFSFSECLPARVQKRDANFWSVRKGLTRSLSGEPGDPKGKYFHEAIFHPHYDGRFANKVLKPKDKQKALIALLQSYLSTMNDIGAQTWIMHGTLMGWWWNRRILPWDSDVDVQMSESSMRYLADYYNMTMHHYRFKDGRTGGKDYLLEINPNYVNGSTSDFLNVIDARWIDMDTGLFIDITSLRRNTTAEAEGHHGMMMCKDKHHYREKDIYPLRISTLEGVPVRIPHAYTELLEEEYRPVSLTKVDFEGHHFDSEQMLWIPYREWRIAQVAKSKAGLPPVLDAPPPNVPVIIPGHGPISVRSHSVPAVVQKRSNKPFDTESLLLTPK